MSKKKKYCRYVNIFPNFKNRERCEKYLKDNKHNSLHLVQTFTRIFVLGHYLFLVPRSSQFSLSYALGKLFALLGKHNFPNSFFFLSIVLNFVLIVIFILFLGGGGGGGVLLIGLTSKLFFSNLCTFFCIYEFE